MFLVNCYSISPPDFSGKNKGTESGLSKRCAIFSFKLLEYTQLGSFVKSLSEPPSELQLGTKKRKKYYKQLLLLLLSETAGVKGGEQQNIHSCTIFESVRP